MRTYRSSGMNWAWYLELRFVNGEVEILKHYRRHLLHDKHPKAIGTYHLTEGQGRIVTGVILAEGNKQSAYKVINKKHIFNYGE